MFVSVGITELPTVLCMSSDHMRPTCWRSKLWLDSSTTRYSRACPLCNCSSDKQQWIWLFVRFMSLNYSTLIGMSVHTLWQTTWATTNTRSWLREFVLHAVTCRALQVAVNVSYCHGCSSSQRSWCKSKKEIRATKTTCGPSNRTGARC